jgi:hypothetical protein
VHPTLMGCASVITGFQALQGRPMLEMGNHSLRSVGRPTRGKVGAMRHMYPIGNGDVVTLRTDRSDPTSYDRRFAGSRSQVEAGSLVPLFYLRAARFRE